MGTIDQNYKVLLVDDDPEEAIIIKRALKAVTKRECFVTHVSKCSRAIPELHQNDFDLIILDNRLSRSINAKFTVPMMNAARGAMPMVIATADISQTYLCCASHLGVDYIIDKLDLVKFLGGQVNGLVFGVQDNLCGGTSKAA
ncbi:hypothetical protein GCM10007853_16530 [Algimonas ampicilliniresistens]|uniref:Response regulatory domain-containing protein n=1 Tax=Algimonas ampicilliniresistens TaxID=1298735 RepID=A0ABQ5V8E1_9PROT|nr:response regulator [Algimonas ampicilliniresistens]GLQ23779.1 hypothetical protein GCM10007853_16530 [Algimonas ampicilliniresistens]